MDHDHDTSSHQMPLRLPKSLWRKLREQARAKGISLNGHICVVLDDFVNGSEPTVALAGTPEPAVLQSGGANGTKE